MRPEQQKTGVEPGIDEANDAGHEKRQNSGHDQGEDPEWCFLANMEDKRDP
jgi:hypothetical protein